MQTSRRTFLDEFVAYVGDAGDVRARNRAEQLLNRVLQTIWMKREWSQFLMPSAYEVTLAASARAVTLPDYFGRIAGSDQIVRNLTNGGILEPISRNALEDTDPLQGTTDEIPGVPRYHMIQGTSPIQTQPATTGEALEVLSSAAADTTVKVFIEGLDANGMVTQVEVTLNGTTPVALGTIYAPVTKFGKAYPDGTDPTTEGTSSAGTVTLRKVSGSTVLQRLTAPEDSREMLTMVVYPITDAAYRLAIPIVRGIERAYRDAEPLPAFWENAVFEKMVMQWRAGDQDGASVDLNVTWPALVDLICYENTRTRQAWETHPYGGTRY